MNWKAFLQTIISAAVNAAIGALVAHTSSSVPAGLTAMAVGTAIAHGATSPFDKGR